MSRCKWPNNCSSCSHKFDIMKFIIAIVAVSSFSGTTLAFAPSASSRIATALNAKVGIYYSTQTGNCEIVAEYIAQAAGLEFADIGDVSDDMILGLDSIIVGAPTWNTDEEEERSGTEWDTWLYSSLPKLDLSGKKVAVFGVGDQQSYNDYYCDAAGELYDQFKKCGCTMCGFTSIEGYEHSASKAERDGKFVGLMCDEDNQYDLSEGRAKDWVDQLKGEGFF
ncbi:flavodoxin [Skeletonema marinoi]|uniref:Flavodoxin n=1 Tax=Skeletonema marinoi TaxID=267567 RepID=A0AAD9D3I4_9STRA|nr:flavodoxin [Skeletonema marinoi]